MMFMLQIAGAVVTTAAAVLGLGWKALDPQASAARRRWPLALMVVGALGTGGATVARENESRGQSARAQAREALLEAQREGDSALLADVAERSTATCLPDDLRDRLEERLRVPTTLETPVSSAPKRAPLPCGDAPTLTPGAHQLRVATTRSLASAKRRWDVVRDAVGPSRAPFVQPPVTGSIDRDPVYFVTINAVSAEGAREVCDWLKDCKKVDPGLLPCEIRPL